MRYILEIEETQRLFIKFTLNYLTIILALRLAWNLKQESSTWRFWQVSLSILLPWIQLISQNILNSNFWKIVWRNNGKENNSNSESVHSKIIAQFLFETYEGTSQDCTQIFPYLSLLQVNRIRASYLSEEILVFAIKKLNKSGQYEDSLILRLIYLLRVSPHTIYLLDFSKLDSFRLFVFYDEDVRYHRTVKLEYSLYNDICFYHNLKNFKKRLSRNLIRRSKDKTIVKGDFIFSSTPKTIYNRFNNQFDGRLPWFVYTPKMIKDLSFKNYPNKKPTLKDL